MVRKFLRTIWPSRALVGKATPVFGMLIFALVGYFLGTSKSPAKAQQAAAPFDPTRKSSDSGYDQRVVAYIYGNIAITREELGEFLIARYGAKKLELLIKKRIVDLHCKSEGIEVTEAQVDFQFRQDLSRVPMDLKTFEDRILRPQNMTAHEWKEDVVRHNLLLAKLVEPSVKVTEEDLRKGFEGRYGPKVECRWIVLPDSNQKERIWETVSRSEADFIEHATKKNLPQLCASGGKVPPIHKHFGDPNIERYAFNLKVGA